MCVAFMVTRSTSNILTEIFGSDGNPRLTQLAIDWSTPGTGAIAAISTIGLLATNRSQQLDTRLQEIWIVMVLAELVAFAWLSAVLALPDLTLHW